jgi:hypothetical protein
MLRFKSNTESEGSTGKKPARSNRRRRLGVASAVAIVGAVAVGGLTAAPASASDRAFEIFYSPNCTGASRVYDNATNPGKESWINDTFNLNRAGGGGFGQRIRANAASMYLRGSGVTIYKYTGSNVFVFIREVNLGTCINFDSTLRNQNIAWAF